MRYQLGNHLGTVALEVDDVGEIISYEEYHPYGTTAWQAPELTTVSLKRYRYTGMERDEESGLQRHGVRYYAVWLGRWGSADPIGLGDGVNRFGYVHGNPIGKIDPSGLGDPNETTSSSEQFPVILWGSKEGDFIWQYMLDYNENMLDELPSAASATPDGRIWFTDESGKTYIIQFPRLDPETRMMMGPDLANAMEAQLGYLFTPRNPLSSSYATAFSPNESIHFHIVSLESDRAALEAADKKLADAMQGYQAEVNNKGDDAVQYAIQAEHESLGVAMHIFFETVSRIPSARIVYHTREYTASDFDPIRHHQFALMGTQDIDWPTVSSTTPTITAKTFAPDYDDLDFPNLVTEPTTPGLVAPSQVVAGHYPPKYQPSGYPDQFEIWPGFALAPSQAASMNQNLRITCLGIPW